MTDPALDLPFFLDGPDTTGDARLADHARALGAAADYPSEEDPLPSSREPHPLAGRLLALAFAADDLPAVGLGAKALVAGVARLLRRHAAALRTADPLASLRIREMLGIQARAFHAAGEDPGADLLDVAFAAVADSITAGSRWPT